MELTHAKTRFCINKRQESGRGFPDQKNVKPYSGFIIIRFADHLAYREGDDLYEFAKRNQLERLLVLLERHRPISARRNIRSASPKQLLELEKRASQSEFPPLHSLTNYWRLDYRQVDADLEELAKMLQGLYEIDLAYPELSVTDPFINAGNDTFAAQQTYLDAAPTGIDARWAWTQGAEGAGVGFIDLEQGWIPTHEDLAGAGPALVYNDNLHGVGSYLGDHGTAVLGMVVGIDNAQGVVGIAPTVDYVKMVSHYEASSGTALHVADAIVAAIGHMNAGDVLLLEVQRNYLPTETDSADFDAIRLAVALGIIVVEAAGNGNNDLDAWTSGGLTILNRASAAFRDSGAIMVGASVSTVPHDRAWFSNYGSRIDCYGWGENIVTSGYANRAAGSLGNSATATLNDDYTSTFGGTSGASPMITGAAILLQGLYKDTVGATLSPLQMRSLLSNPATGTPQGGGVAGNISVMPNLRAIIENTLNITPDVYLRDAVGDDGSVPSGMAISASPDIIVRKTTVADPTAAFGEGSGTENSNTQGHTVEAGQDNYVYVRMKNRGLTPANGVTATVYWSEVATLVTPNLWNLVGTSAPVNVPVGDTLVVTDPITWDESDIPAPGHYCFVGLLNHAQDAAPALPSATNFDWDAFRAFIRNNNNVTWRNFNVEDVDPNDPNFLLPFYITGTPDRRRSFDFEIVNALPQKPEIWLEMPHHLFAFLNFKGLDVRIDEERQQVAVLLPPLRRISLCEVPLPKDARFACRFRVRGGQGYERGTHHLAIRQLFDGEEVGRVTWAFKPKG